MISLVMFIIGAPLLVLSVLGTTFFGVAWGSINSIVALILGLVFILLGLAAWVFSSFYIKPSANFA